MSFESRVEKFRQLAGLAGARTNEAILSAAVAQGYTGQNVNGALRFLAQQAGGGNQANLNDALHAAAAAADKASWADVSGADISFGPDWANWDGGDDGPVQRFLTSGGHGPASLAGVSAGQFVGVYRKISGNLFYAAVFDIDADDTMAMNAALELTTSGQIFPNLVRLTDTRYAVLQAGANNCAVTLLGKSGKSMSELAAETTDSGAGLPGQISASLTRLSDTHVAYVILKNATPDNGYYVGVIDTSGDTLNWGVPVQISTKTLPRYPDITALSATEFVAAAKDKVAYCTVSGATVTLASNIEIVAGDEFDDMFLAKVDASTVLLAYEDQNGAPDTTWLNTFTVSGGTLTPGTPATLVVSKTGAGPGGNRAISLDEGNFMFTAMHSDVANETRSVVVNVDESKNITVHDAVTFLAETGFGRADHPTLTLLPGTNGGKVVLVAQDSTVDPTEQVAMRVLNG